MTRKELNTNKRQKEDNNKKGGMEREGDMESIYNIHICDWNGQQCEEWATYVCRKRGVDVTEVDLRGFRVTDGVSLQQQSRQELCVIVGDQYGAMFWKELRSFRAQQKQRCSKCVNVEEIPALIPWSTNNGAQHTATDLSSQSHTTHRSPQKLSPRLHPYHTSPYAEQASPGSYEARSRYPEEHSPPRSYEGSPSPVYQERVRFHEDYSPYPPYLPPSPESCRSHTHSPQLMYPDQFYWKAHEEPEPIPLPTRKPLPELLPLDDIEEESCTNTPQLHHRNQVLDHWLAKDMRLQGSISHETNHSIQIIYSSHPNYPPRSSPSSFGTHQGQMNANMAENPGRSHHSQVIQYAHPLRPGFQSHAHPLPRPLVHTNYRRNYAYGNHPNESSGINYGSDEDVHDEPGKLVIDLDDNSSETTDKDSEGGIRQGQEDASFPHLKKIPTKRRRDRGPKSWEFLMRLLACPETNPSIIRWEDEAEGSFRLVQPQEIANMWGTRSKKEDLSYNNFARALRYHYKTKLLYKISERQLVYGCGPAALEFYRQLLSEEYKSQPNSSIG